MNKNMDWSEMTGGFLITRGIPSSRGKTLKGKSPLTRVRSRIAGTIQLCDHSPLRSSPSISGIRVWSRKFFPYIPEKVLAALTFQERRYAEITFWNE